MGGNPDQTTLPISHDATDLLSSGRAQRRCPRAHVAPKRDMSLLSPRALSRFQIPFQDPLDLFFNTSRTHYSLQWKHDEPPPFARGIHSPFFLLPQGLPGPPGPKVRALWVMRQTGGRVPCRREGEAALTGAEGDLS